jgi:hypothetical protein
MNEQYFDLGIGIVVMAGDWSILKLHVYVKFTETYALICVFNTS